MALFGFGKKKQPDQASQGSPSLALPFPSDPQGSMPDLPPLPSLGDVPKGLPGSPEYENFDQSLDSPPIPSPGSTPAPPVPSAADSIDWTAPADNSNRLPDDIPSPPKESSEDLPPLKPLPVAQQYAQEQPAVVDRAPPPSPSLPPSDLPASPPPAQDDNFINIELPAFDGEDVGELPPAPAPKIEPEPVAAPAPAPMPVMAPKPRRQELPEKFKDMEQPLPVYKNFRSNVDIYVDMDEYADIIRSLQQLKRLMNSRTTALDQMMQTEEDEKMQFHEFHSLLESNQRLIMKIDRIIFDSNEAR